MSVSAIIVAAGSGTRLGHPEAKAFVQVGVQPILYYSLRTIREVTAITEVIVTLPPGKDKEAGVIAQRAGLRIPVKLITGGAERQDSVRIALSVVTAENSVVVVHDAARPFATVEMFDACIAAAARSGGAIAAIPVADTLKESVQGAVSATRPREGLFAAQTPQAFRRDLLIAAHAAGSERPIIATDDAFLVERLGTQVQLVAGSSLNFKITTPEDLRLARALIAADRPLGRRFE